MKISPTYNNRGFTIVELLIVIVVIAILAAISVVAYNGIQQRARTSAQAYTLSQTEKEIMVYALQENGESISVGGTLVGYQYDSSASNLLRPLNGTTDITMYVVQDITTLENSYPTYLSLEPSSSANAMRLYGNAPGSSYVGYRIDTSAQTNVTASVGGYRVVGKTIIGWLQVSNNGTVRDFAYNQAASQNTASLSSHAGWNFTSMTAAAYTSKAALVFNSAQNESTRAQVIKWLAKKYNVTL